MSHISVRGEQSTSAEIAALTSLAALAASGAGQFIRKTSLTTFENATPSGGTSPYYLVAANDAPQDVKDIADYVCDGTADQVQIQAAIDALPDTGGRILLSQGQFNISSTITIDVPKGTYISGAGWGTIVYGSNGLNAYVFTTSNASDRWYKLSDFKIDGNAPNQNAGGCIDAAAAVESEYTNIWFHRPYDWGIYLASVSGGAFGHHNKVHHNHFDNGQDSSGIGQGVRMTENDENEVAFNDFQFMGGSGRGSTGCVHDQSAGLNNISFNTFVRCYQGIRMNDSSRSRIIGNIFDECLDHNIYLKGPECIVSHNFFYEIGYTNTGAVDAIFIDFYGGNTISDNYFRSDETNGGTKSFIEDTGSGDNFITDNTFDEEGTLTAAYIVQSGTNRVFNNRGWNVNTLTGTLSIGTSSAFTCGSIELGHASDTTITRSSAGVIAVEGVVIPSISSTNTLTNKRITKRVTSTSGPGATPTINTDNCDVVHLTALATAITSMTSNLSGTPVEGDTLRIDFTDNGTARAITWGTSFEASGNVALPTTTVTSTRLDVGFVWNTATSKWRCVAVA